MKSTNPDSSSDLDNIRVFVEVVQRGSFTQAAARLGMPKSSVSRRVSSLEQALGARLLQRTTRRLSLTEVGELYFDYAQRALAQLEEAQRAVLELSHTPRGILRVTMPADFALLDMSRIFAQFARRYPDIQLIVELTNRRVDLVAEGFDVALRTGPLSDSSLTARRVCQTSFALFATSGYLERAGRPERPDQLSQHRCLKFARARPLDRLVLDRGKERIEVQIRPTLICDDLGFLLQLTQEGLGISSLPTFGSGEACLSGLERVLPQYRSGLTTLHAVYPSPHHLTAKVRAFIEFVSEALAALS